MAAPRLIRRSERAHSSARNARGPSLQRAARPMGFPFLPAIAIASFAKSLKGPGGGCGDRYASLVRAEGDRSFDQPYGFPGVWCNYVDVDAWNNQANYVFALVRRAWNELVKTENAAQDWTDSRALRDQVTSYETARGALKSGKAWQIFGAGGCGEGVSAAQSNIRDGTCMLDLLQSAIERRGGSPVGVPSPPAPAPSPLSPGTLTAGLGGLALIALAALVLPSMMRRGRKAAA